MFSKNALLFVATTIALGAGPVAGRAGGLHQKIVAAKEIAKLDALNSENVRLDGRTPASLLAGCVVKKDISEGDALEPRDLICDGASEMPLELPRGVQAL